MVERKTQGDLGKRDGRRENKDAGDVIKKEKRSA